MPQYLLIITSHIAVTTELMPVVDDNMLPITDWNLKQQLLSHSRKKVADSLDHV